MFQDKGCIVGLENNGHLEKRVYMTGVETSVYTETRKSGYRELTGNKGHVIIFVHGVICCFRAGL